MDASTLLCIGHRGAMGLEPENTLRAIGRAIELGAACIEIDVQWIDNHLMVFHDERLERTTNGSGALRDHSYEALRLLDAGKGEHIPTLEEVCNLLDGRAGLNIEIKGPDAAAPVMATINALTAVGRDKETFLLSAFSHSVLRKIHRLDPDLKLGVLSAGAVSEDLRFAVELGAFSIHPHRETVSQPFVSQARAAGLAVYVYTVNDPQEILRMRDLGVDGIFTDFPDRIANPASGKVDPPFWTRRPIPP